MIFLFKGDALHSGQVITKSKRCLEFDDGVCRPLDTQYVYVDLTCMEGNLPIHAMNRDWNQNDWHKIENPVFRNRMRELKEGEGLEIMCELVNQLIKEKEAEMRESIREEVMMEVQESIKEKVMTEVREEISYEAKEEEKTQIALRQLKRGRSLEDVCDIVDRGPSTVRGWAMKAGLQL